MSLKKKVEQKNPTTKVFHNNAKVFHVGLFQPDLFSEC